MALFERGSTFTLLRRVSVDQVDGSAVEQPIDVLGLAPVPAQQPMLAEDPEITGLGRRLVWRFGHGIRIGQSLGCVRLQQALQFVRRDALDILVLCLEGSVDLNAAIQWVADELPAVHPALGAELNIVEGEVQLGLSPRGRVTQFC